ncbi:putative transcription factor, enhancer of yellow 2, transcription factor EnY2 superfamily [Helianthus annuus]|nr:putative transcription factor, enhancer of yellow 2, transcription factor EnY2 superfamily [Helianthus annuus]
MMVACCTLIKSAEKERLKELLREMLNECGWKDEMKSLCRFSLSVFLFLYKLLVYFRSVWDCLLNC